MEGGLGVLIAYSAAVVFASVLGGMLPEWIRLTHERMQLMISTVGGLMLGIAVFHMIPHALVTMEGRADTLAWGIMTGLLVTFFLLRFFHFHQHGPADFGLHADEKRAAAEQAASSANVPPASTHEVDHGTHLCSSDLHPKPADKCHHPEPTGPARWLLVLTGLGMHTLTDGIALASGVLSETQGDSHQAMLPGIGIFLAVLFHKPLDAVSITSLMHPVTTPSTRLTVNVGFALMCPLGALLFWFGVGGLAHHTLANIAGFALAFSSGVFLCIALSDLLPEMEFHSHSRVPLTAALLLGIGLAWAIGLLEGEHAHEHHPLPGSPSESGAPSSIGQDHAHVSPTHDHAHDDDHSH
ncbi:MAG: iron permease [Pirellulaceae bacterium]|nr:MAG: iron permease [Pirellulaceae bacterium]